MIEYYNRQIPVSLTEIVVPDYTALIIVDMQNEFCRKGEELLCPSMVSKLKTLIEKAREAGVLVIYIHDTLLQDRMSDSAAWIRKYMVGLKTDDPNDITEGSLEGSENHNIIEEIKPLESDLRIIKYRSSAFYGTPLDLILRSNGIKTTIITGVVTDGCVESTARDASNQYFVVIPEDCVWSGNWELHEASLVVMKHRYDTVKSDDIIDIWEKNP